MSLDIHNRIIKIVYDLCLEFTNAKGKSVYSDIFADHIGVNYKPLILTANMGKRKKPLARKYNPDVWAKVDKKHKYDIYEVWHSETEGDAIVDVLLSSFVEGIRYLHIICTEENISSLEAQEILDFIINKVHDDEGNILINEGYIISDIPKKILNNDSKIKSYLKVKLEF